jgi:hypothetical protein
MRAQGTNLAEVSGDDVHTADAVVDWISQQFVLKKR